MKIEIKVFYEDDDVNPSEREVLGSFESAAEVLGKMERRYEDEQKSPIRENYEVNEVEQEAKAERDVEMIEGL